MRCIARVGVFCLFWRVPPHWRKRLKSACSFEVECNNKGPIHNEPRCVLMSQSWMLLWNDRLKPLLSQPSCRTPDFMSFGNICGVPTLAFLYRSGLVLLGEKQTDAGKHWGTCCVLELVYSWFKMVQSEAGKDSWLHVMIIYGTDANFLCICSSHYHAVMRTAESKQEKAPQQKTVSFRYSLSPRENKSRIIPSPAERDDTRDEEMQMKKKEKIIKIIIYSSLCNFKLAWLIFSVKSVGQDV